MGTGKIARYEQFLLFPTVFSKAFVLQTGKNQGLFGKRLNVMMVPKRIQSTLSQTTNFRLFQTERLCRRQFQIQQKRRKVIQKDRKHCGKRKNCS